MKNREKSCTTILVGKNATFDGSTMMARDEDIYNGLNPKKHVVVIPNNNKSYKYKSFTTGIEIELPDNPLQYTSKPDAREGKGIFGEAGINSLNIAMTATETITTNPMVLSADPFVDGIGEEDLLTIILPYIKSAKEGVFRLGALLEKYGTYESNGVGFQDENEWWVETIGGHHFVAKRIPDDSYVGIPNQFSILNFDFPDAFGEQKNNICSQDLIPFILNNHLNLDLSLKNSCDLKKEKNFNCRIAFGSKTDLDKIYSTPRAWFMQRYFNSKSYNYDDPEGDHTPESLNLPWSMVPDKKITVEDIKYVLSSYYQGTKYNPYNNKSNEKGKYRTIGYNKNCQLTLSHIRGHLSDNIKSIEWISFGPNPFNAFIPQYSKVNDTPKYLKEFKDEVSTDNFYWINLIIAALSDANYNEALPLIEKYQNLLFSKNHEFINEFDNKFNGKIIGIKIIEEANNKIV